MVAKWKDCGVCAIGVGTLQRVGDGDGRQYRAGAVLEGSERAVQDGGLDEGAHGILDEHVADFLVRKHIEAGEDGLLAGRAAMHDGQAVTSGLRGGAGQLEQRGVIGVYHHDDMPGGLPIDKEIERMGDDRPSADAAVLLGAFGMAAGPFAATGGNDHHTAG
jgi:hypothetical protein